MTIKELKSKMNEWGQTKVPFLFIIDFEMKKPLAWRLDEISPEEVLFFVNGVSNDEKKTFNENRNQFSIIKFPPSLDEYKSKFDLVMKRLEYGDSFLTNLTIKSEIKIDQTLKELFHCSKAKYKLWLKDQFLVFSPETFIKIINGKIFSFPMKGTIDASLPDAAKIILDDKKELAEHVTIVDLIRNDLSMVASHVNVKRFRYIDEIKTSNKTLLQVSSEIEGSLDPNYYSQLGDILVTLLPAGSVSGAPKEKTLEIIRSTEGENRGYYTGVFGIFDGKNVDSGVMIRFIEQRGNKFFYRSGGGITTQSDLKSEYEEAINKIYVTVD